MNKIKQFIKNIEMYIKNGVHNPLATLTNLTYVWLGLFALSETILFGALMVGLGIASTGFHWVRNDAWHKADIVAIYYVFSVMAGYAWFGDVGLGLGVIAGAVAHWMFDNRPEVSTRHIIAVFGFLLIVPFWITHGWEKSLFVLMWFALAGIMTAIAVHFDPDEDGIWYDVWHGKWHIFSGVGIFYLAIWTIPVFHSRLFPAWLT